MQRTQFTLLTEPEGDLYRGLIDYAITDCQVAILVVRHSLSLGLRGRSVLDQLNAFLEHKTESSEWPGTKLLDKTAWVFRYNFGSECATVLKKATNALYSWRQPDLPEDLCLLRGNGTPWLVSIAHEKDSFLYLSQDEILHLLGALPMLKSLIRMEAF
jgi:hypothetical protein